MELTAEEQRRWRQLEAELCRDRRLAARAARFDAMARGKPNLIMAPAATTIPAVIWIPVVAGGCLGLALLIAGITASGAGLSAVGAAVLVTTLMLAGAVLLVIGTAGSRSPGGRGRRE